MCLFAKLSDEFPDPGKEHIDWHVALMAQKSQLCPYQWCCTGKLKPLNLLQRELKPFQLELKPFQLKYGALEVRTCTIGTAHGYHSLVQEVKTRNQVTSQKSERCRHGSLTGSTKSTI
jgi:hypothetical protein